MWSALAMADCSTLLIGTAAARGLKARIAWASATDLPRTRSATSRPLRADVRTYFAVALHDLGGLEGVGAHRRSVEVRSEPAWPR